MDAESSIEGQTRMDIPVRVFSESPGCTKCYANAYGGPSLDSWECQYAILLEDPANELFGMAKFLRPRMSLLLAILSKRGWYLFKSMSTFSNEKSANRIYKRSLAG